MADLALDPLSTAVLALDFENEVVHERGGLAEMGLAAELVRRGVFPKTQRLINEARAAGVPIIYVVVAWRPGYPEMQDNAPLFLDVKGRGNILIEGTWGTEVHEALRPQSGDVLVIKRNVGAFAGTDLDKILRAKNVTTLVLSGVSTRSEERRVGKECRL